MTLGFYRLCDADGIRLPKWNPGLGDKHKELEDAMSDMMDRARAKGAPPEFMDKVLDELKGVDVWRCELGHDPPADGSPCA